MVARAVGLLEGRWLLNRGKSYEEGKGKEHRRLRSNYREARRDRDNGMSRT